MKRLNGYEKAQAYTESERLPAGGYVLRILDVKYQSNDWGDVIVLYFDIDEGEQKGFFERNYKNQTGKIRNGKVHTGSGCRRMMEVRRTSPDSGDSRQQ